MPIDYSEYPPNWFTEIRPAILSRADNCCEDCGVKNGSIILRDKHSFRYICETEWQFIKDEERKGFNHLKAIKNCGFTKIILTIAHLDHDKENHSVELDRLKALCQKCHLNLDLKRHIENRKYGRNHRKNQIKLEL